MTAAGAPSRTLLDDPRATALTSLVVLLTLFATTGLDGPTPWPAVHAASATGFCVWVLARRRRRPRMARALAVASLGGALIAPDAGLLLVIGTTVLTRSVARWWLATLLGVLVLGSAVGLTATGVRSADLRISSIPLVLALSALLAVLDRLATAPSPADATTLRRGVERDRARLGDELRSQIGRTLCAARQDVRAAVDTASTSGRPVGDQVAEQLRSLQSVIDHGIDQLGRLSVEPVAATLPSELHAAREVCERLGVTTVISADPIADHAVADACALVVREAVTNMLRHATPTRCVVAIRCSAHEVVLSVTNDGAAGVATGSGPTGAGSGQRRWQRTVSQLGARISAGALEGGRYHVLVRFPARPSPPAGAGSRRRADLIGRKGARWGFGS
ncbi:MAG: sensor histidine kinase [Phycicoccus sp.]